MTDLSKEVSFQTTRSGGRGGQNVNKVETAVIASFHIDSSQLFTESQKITLREKLVHRITGSGCIQVKSQVHRTQLANKEEALKKIIVLIHKALEKKKPRIATQIKKAEKEKRLESKKRKSEIKMSRKRIRTGDI